MNIPAHLTADEARAFLLRQIATGRYMILGTVIITLVNLIFLLMGADFYIMYSSAAAYYPVQLGLLFDGWVIGSYTLTALVLAAVILATYLMLWHLAKKNLLWLKVSIGLLVLDTVILVGRYLLLSEDVANCLWELVIHAAVIWEMGKALSARKQLDTIPTAEKEEILL